MDWSDLPFIAMGLGLGVGSNWLLWRSRQPAIPTHPNLETLQKQLKQVELAYQMAATMSQFKAGFLARVSHELRSPLNSLIGTHQLILSGLCDDPAEERQFIENAHEAALKMMKLIDRILEVAKVEHGTHGIEIQPLQLTKVLEEVYHLTHLQAQNRNLRLKIVLPDPEIYILADPRQFRQVLLNLVDTAIALMDDGNISLSAQVDAEAGYVYIWLEDQRPASTWHEPLDLLQSSLPTDQKWSERLSPGMSLLTSQLLLELMQGRLEILASPSEAQGQDGAFASVSASPPNFSRIQCSIPLFVPEAELTSTKIQSPLLAD